MDIYTKVTDRIVDALQRGVPPWRCPWSINNRSTMSLPLNAKTKKSYQGINVMLLWLQEQESPYWATAKTWQD